MRSLVGTVLLGAHYRVVVAREGREALRFIDEARAPFDLVVTDVLMPEVSGGMLAGAIRARGASPHMLFISGYNAPQAVYRGRATRCSRPRARQRTCAMTGARGR